MAAPKPKSVEEWKAFKESALYMAVKDPKPYGSAHYEVQMFNKRLDVMYGPRESNHVPPKSTYFPNEKLGYPGADATILNCVKNGKDQVNE